MTTPGTYPKVVVVAEQEIFNLLGSSGAGWDVQHCVTTVSQMWDDLQAGRLAQDSSVIVFSDRTVAGSGELEAAIAAMAPAATTFVICWDPEQAHTLLDRVKEAASTQGVNPEAPVYFVTPDSGRYVLDTFASVLTGRVGFPTQWGGTVEAPLTPAQPIAPPLPQPVAAPIAQPVAAPHNYSVAVPTPNPAATAPAHIAAPVASPFGLGQQRTNPKLPGQTTLTITSSKGGCGKSSVAMLTAAQIRKSSELAFAQGLIPKPLSVVLIDMDTRDGQVASLIAKYTPTALNIRVSPEWDEETVLKFLVFDPKLGIDTLLAPVRPRTADDVGPEFYRHVLHILQSTHDVVVMDTSVNYLDPLISTVCLPESDAILFVTTLATTSVQGMARALREITEDTATGGMGISRSKIGIVVNMALTGVGMDKETVLSAALSVPLIGTIPLATKDVLTATNAGKMHSLLSHPLLGPAFYRLAKACLKDVPLLPLVSDGAEQSAAASIAAVFAQSSEAPGAAAPAAVAAPNGPAADVSAEQKKRRFGRG